MTAQDFIHPADAAAISSLEAIPVLPSITKKLMDLNSERIVHGLNLASKVKLSPTQLPSLYNLLPPICNQLGIPQPEFYLELDPNPNAYAFGDTYTSISINSGIVEMLKEDELKAILGHECGHILCRHMLYHSLAFYLFEGPVENRDSNLSVLAEPILAALRTWQRMSEFSCDRVAAFVAGPQATIRALARLAGGPAAITNDLNLVELAEQADEYDRITNGNLWNRYLKTSTVLDMTHPFTTIRIREVLRWVASEQFKSLRERYPMLIN